MSDCGNCERLAFERDKYKAEAHLLTRERDEVVAEVDRYQKALNRIAFEKSNGLWEMRRISCDALNETASLKRQDHKNEEVC